MTSDPYKNTRFAAARLFKEWQMHPRLIVACDFDDTVFDFHGADGDGYPRFTHDSAINLIRDCAALNFYIVVFTASAPSRWDAIRKYMKEVVNVEIASINANPIPLPYGNNGKMYYNILLDDRAGLGQAMNTLEFLIRKIKQQMHVSKAEVITSPFLHNTVNKLKVFLAGSIEMGKADNWQDRMIKDLGSVDCCFLNPRRPDWDDTWVQSKDNPKFREQVEWELEGLEEADVVALYFAPGTISPISLLESLHMRAGRLVVCCPPGYARKGNVDITCERHGVTVHENWEDFTKAVVEAVDSYTVESEYMTD